MADFIPIELLQVALSFGEQEIRVGRMASRNNKLWFEYDSEFLDSGLSISPYNLPLETGVKRSEYQPFEGLFGVFNDSLPDGWGKMLLDRALMTRGIPYQRLTPLDRLAYVGHRGMGALVYKPDHSGGEQGANNLDLNEIADEVDIVLKGKFSNILEELYNLGGSSAGARPKVVVMWNPQLDKVLHGNLPLQEGYEHWLIKFNSSSDLIDIGRIEYAYSMMARAAGVEMAETRLFPGTHSRAYFGTRRFDRAGNKRLHIHTASGMLQVNHRIPNLDYAVLMNCAMDLQNDIREAEKIFRLAVFNVFAHNRDDHSKNFSFIMDELGNWRFAPAYDLTYSFGPGGQHSTTILREGLNPGSKELEALGEMFSLKGRKQTIEEVREAVGRWPEFAKEASVTKTSRELISSELRKIK